MLIVEAKVICSLQILFLESYNTHFGLNSSCEKQIKAINLFLEEQLLIKFNSKFVISLDKL